LIIQIAAQTDEDILEAEAAAAPSEGEEEDDDDENAFGPRYYGSIISWNTADQLGPTGILYIILALILVSGRVMSDGKLCSKRSHDLNGSLGYCS
jgi:hypothetical protein